MKYQNTSGFRQTLTIGGSKQVVFPDDVVELDRELFNPAFDQVPDNTPVTFKTRTLRKISNNQEISNLHTKLSEVQKGTENLTEIAAQAAASKVSDLEQNITETQNKHSNDLALLTSRFEEFEKIVKKRLEILKSAVQNLESEIGQLYGDDSEGSEDPKGFRHQ